MIARVAKKAKSNGTPMAIIPKSRVPCGKTARAGIAGSGPAAEPSGEISEPAPIEKPTPVSQLAAKITKFGSSAICAEVIAKPPKKVECTVS